MRGGGPPVPELSCVFCGRAAKSTTEHAEPARDFGHQPGVLEELDPCNEVAYRRLMNGARIAFAGIRSGQTTTRIYRGRRAL